MGGDLADSQDHIVIERVPKERKNRARKASICIFLITAILVLTFCFSAGTEEVYYPSPANKTNVFCQKKEKQSFSYLFPVALGLFSVVLGTLVDRLSLVVEEYHHLSERYGGSRRKMLAACFSGVSWGPVICLILFTAIIAVLIISVTGMPWFELRYLLYIANGIGVGPLVMQLLNLNTQSEIHISTILEKKGMYVANGLAWSYYFNYLIKALPEFREKVRSSNLSLKKLLLLIPHDCYMEENLELTDYENIEFKGYVDADNNAFPRYRLTISDSDQRDYAIQYAKEPLKTLKEMSKLNACKAFKERTCEDEVKLLYRTLVHEILKDPPHPNCKATCILVPRMIKDLDKLRNGGLVKCIWDVVQKLNTEQPLVDGFVGLGENKKENKEKGATTKVVTDNTKQHNPIESSEIMQESGDGRNTNHGASTSDNIGEDILTSVSEHSSVL